MIELLILSTTDIHSNLRGYDYYKDEPAESYGLSRVATLVATERKRNPNAFLVDAGDFLQGNPMGDVYSKNTQAKNPTVAAFEFLKYDAVAIGNHEFDFGLSYLKKAIANSTVGFSSANVKFRTKLTEPFRDLAERSIRKLRTVDGHKVQVCFFGVTPPQILTWNKSKLEGLVAVDDGLQAADQMSKELKETGCDIVVALVHGGINPLPYTQNDENPAWHIAGLSNVDAVVAGHAHQEFPSTKFEGLKDADLANGLVRGKPLVMAGQWGGQLGRIALQLTKSNNGFKVTSGKAQLISTKGAVEDQAFVTAVEMAHQNTLLEVRKPVGTFTNDVDTYFARFKSSAAVDLVNQAQLWHAQKILQKTEFAQLPILSAAAPFKAGFKGEFTSIPKGTVAVKNVADLYVYPNTMQAVKLTGAQIKDWLERSAEAFYQIKESDGSDRPLLNEAFPTYNFDVFLGIEYEIDVSKPIGQRISMLIFDGKPLDPKREFVVVTNNYRAGGGGKFPHLTAGNIAFDFAIENRQVLFDYLKSKKSVEAASKNNWRLSNLQNVQGRVWVDLSAKAAAPAFLKRFVGAKDVPSGLVRYVVDFSKI